MKWQTMTRADHIEMFAMWAGLESARVVREGDAEDMRNLLSLIEAKGRHLFPHLVAKRDGMPMQSTGETDGS